MAGYWLSSFFACLWTEMESRSINSSKRARPIFTEQARSIKDLLYDFQGNFLRDTAGSPERARRSYLARSGLPARDSHRAIWFILPARGASQIIIKPIPFHLGDSTESEKITF